MTAVGLTARQYDAYRVALFSATLAAKRDMQKRLGPTPPSVGARNVAFVAAYPDQLKVLEHAGVKGEDPEVPPSNTPEKAVGGVEY